MVAPRALPAPESSPGPDLEPKSTAERKALRTLKRMMEVTRDLLQASRRVYVENEAGTGAPRASAQAADAPDADPQDARPLEAWEVEARAALEAGTLTPLIVDTTSSPPRSGHLRIREVIGIVYQMRELVHLENEIEIRIADLLLEMMDRRAWRCLGYAGLAEYAEERLGLGRTAAHGRVRLARGLRRLPQVRAAYEVGRIGMEEARWIVGYLRSAKRGAPPDAALQEAGNEHAETTTLKRLGDERRMLQEKELTDLIALAREMTLRRAGRPQLVSHAAGAPSDAAAVSSADAGAAASGALVAIDAAAAVGCPPSAAGEETASSPDAAPGVGGSPKERDAASRPGASIFPDDAVWAACLRREPGQARRRILALGLGQLERDTRRGPLLARPYTVRLSRDLAARVRATLAVAREDLMRRARAFADQVSPAQEARLLPTERMALEYDRRGQPLRRGVALLALVEELVRVWDDPAGMTRRPLDAIHNRSGWRCSAPGCKARRNLHVHHICYRSLGGSDEEWNEISICAFHHQQGEHGRYARCRGRAPLGVYWRLGVAELKRWYLNDRRIRPPQDFMRA